VSLYAAMLKLDVKSAKARVRGRYFGSGSIKAETVSTGCEGIETELTIESDEDAEKIAKLARVSEDGCFVIQSLRNPTPVSMSVLLNGAEIKIR
jgi:uncharacterized OsmC-like protein